METVDPQAELRPGTVVRFLAVLVPITVPAPYVVVTALETVGEKNVFVIPVRPEVLILLVADAARRHLHCQCEPSERRVRRCRACGGFVP